MEEEIFKIPKLKGFEDQMRNLIFSMYENSNSCKEWSLERFVEYKAELIKRIEFYLLQEKKPWEFFNPSVGKNILSLKEFYVTNSEWGGRMISRSRTTLYKNEEGRIINVKKGVVFSDKFLDPEMQSFLSGNKRLIQLKTIEIGGSSNILVQGKFDIVFPAIYLEIHFPKSNDTRKTFIFQEESLNVMWMKHVEGNYIGGFSGCDYWADFEKAVPDYIPFRKMYPFNNGGGPFNTGMFYNGKEPSLCFSENLESIKDSILMYSAEHFFDIACVV